MTARHTNESHDTQQQLSKGSHNLVKFAIISSSLIIGVVVFSVGLMTMETYLSQMELLENQYTLLKATSTLLRDQQRYRNKETNINYFHDYLHVSKEHRQNRFIDYFRIPFRNHRLGNEKPLRHYGYRITRSTLPKDYMKAYNKLLPNQKQMVDLRWEESLLRDREQPVSNQLLKRYQTEIYNPTANQKWKWLQEKYKELREQQLSSANDVDHQHDGSLSRAHPSESTIPPVSQSIPPVSQSIPQDSTSILSQHFEMAMGADDRPVQTGGSSLRKRRQWKTAVPELVGGDQHESEPLLNPQMQLGLRKAKNESQLLSWKKQGYRNIRRRSFQQWIEDEGAEVLVKGSGSHVQITLDDRHAPLNLGGSGGDTLAPGTVRQVLKNLGFIE